MNSLDYDGGILRRVLLLCRFGVLSLPLIFASLTPLRAAEAPEPVTPCTAEPTDMTIEYGSIVECNIDIIGDTDVFRFSGIANTVAVVALSDLTGWCGPPCHISYPMAYIYAPGNTTPLATLKVDRKDTNGGGILCGSSSPSRWNICNKSHRTGLQSDRKLSD